MSALRASRLIHQTRRIDRFYAGLVHEISGPTQSGKTYLCCNELITYLHDNPGSAYVIDTKGTFPQEVLAELIQERAGESAMSERVYLSKRLDIYEVVQAVHEVQSTFLPGIPASERIGFLLIDNITNPLSLLMQRGQSHGNDLMVCLMRDLTLLSRVHGVCVLLVNTTVKTDSTRALAARTPSDTPRTPLTYRESAFSDVGTKPALGNTWPHLIDFSLFIHPVPEGTRRVPGKRGYIQEVTRSRVGGIGEWDMV